MNGHIYFLDAWTNEYSNNVKYRFKSLPYLKLLNEIDSYQYSYYTGRATEVDTSKHIAFYNILSSLA